MYVDHKPSELVPYIALNLQSFEYQPKQPPRTAWLTQTPENPSFFLDHCPRHSFFRFTSVSLGRILLISSENTETGKGLIVFHNIHNLGKRKMTNDSTKLSCPASKLHPFPNRAVNPTRPLFLSVSKKRIFYYRCFLALPLYLKENWDPFLLFPLATDKTSLSSVRAQDRVQAQSRSRSCFRSLYGYSTVSAEFSVLTFWITDLFFFFGSA